MTGELGKASLDLEANLTPFERGMKSGEKTADSMQHKLDSLAAIANIAESALNRVKMTPGQAAESKVSAEGIISGVHGIKDESREAAREIDRVRITEAQAAESKLAANAITNSLQKVERQAIRTRAATGGGKPGVGIGPFGSGFGRVGVLGAAVGAGTLLGPAAGPGALGLLAAIPTLATSGVGALGTLALAFRGVGKAIGGDKKAFDDLGPSAQAFVKTIRSLDGWFNKLKETAAGGLFPGLTAGLHSALSSGTVSAITKAVQQFATAIGKAGAAWGKYFGSAQFQSIFGPLMDAGARNLGLMSDAALHLFDALGVLARAAIPLTDWMMRAVDHGSRLLDTWLRAKDASGALGGALDEAKTSLQLVGGLFMSLLRAVGALGKALYPVSKIAVKDLTDGLNALAGIIDRNKDKIREIVGGALAALVSTVKTLVPLIGDLVRLLDRVAHAIGGWKTAFEIVIGGFLASKFVTLAGKIGGVWSALGKVGPRLAGLGTTSTVAAGEVGGLRLALLGLGAPEVLAAIAAAAAAIYVLRSKGGVGSTAVPSSLGTAPPGDTSAGTQGEITRGKNGQYYWHRGGRYYPISAKRAAELGATPADVPDSPNRAPGFKLGALTVPQPGTATPYLSYALSRAAATATASDDRSTLNRILGVLRGRLGKATTLGAKTQLQDAINSYASQLKALNAGSVFGADPPWTKNTGTGKPSVVPAAASHLQALASADASRASALGNVGTAAKKFLESELRELNSADKILKAKYETATGKARTQLFASITSVENKMRTVRERIRKAMGDDTASKLALAVDVAKNAVATADVGSAAYDKAVAAEAKALKAEIAYWDKRSKNMKLSIKTRDAALRAEVADKKQLAALLKKSAATGHGTNEAQFLSSFRDIINAFAPNAFPVANNGKTDTHLHDIKTELRQQTPYLKDAAHRSLFPASDYGLASAGAVAG